MEIEMREMEGKCLMKNSCQQNRNNELKSIYSAVNQEYTIQIKTRKSMKR